GYPFERAGSDGSNSFPDHTGYLRGLSADHVRPRSFAGGSRAPPSLERSFRLTKGSAGRAFVIFLLYFIMLYAAVLLFMFPFLFMAGLSAKEPGTMRMWLSLSQVGNFVAGVLVSPFLPIATAVFYYDLRVRKDAFDLLVLMNR